MRSSWALEPQRFGGKGVHPQRLSTPPPPTPRSRAERVHSRAASLVRTATETLKRGLRSPRNAASRNGALGTRLPGTEPSARGFRERSPRHATSGKRCRTCVMQTQVRQPRYKGPLCLLLVAYFESSICKSFTSEYCAIID